MDERKQAVEALLDFEQPLEQVKKALTAFPWDADTELAILSVGHVAKILNGFVSGRICALEVENWADAIEGREDIGFESANQEVLRELVHELANPVITERLTPQRAMELLEKVKSLPS